MEETIVPSVFDEMQNEQQFEYATTGQRFANMLIDIIPIYAFNILIIMAIAIIMAASGKTTDDIHEFATNKLLLYFIGYVNFLVFTTLIEGITKGRSLGKLITRTKAVKQDLSAITWKDAMTRSLCRIIPFEPFSALGGYPWHDQFSKTYVIKKMQKI